MGSVSKLKPLPTSILMAGACLNLAGCTTTPSSDALTVQDALARAEMLDGSQVVVSGYLVLEFEDHNLYTSRRDAVQKVENEKRCIALTLTEDVYSEWKDRDMTSVQVSGVLNKDYCGPNEFCPYACNQIAIEKVEISE